MQSIRVVKLKLITDNPKIKEVALNYRRAANWLSKKIYKRGVPGSSNALAREFYGAIRKKFRLPSQVTTHLFKFVVASYRTMFTMHVWSLAVYKKLVFPIAWRKGYNLTKKGLTIFGDLTKYQSGPIPNGAWRNSKIKIINNQCYLLLCVRVKLPKIKLNKIVIGVDIGQDNLLVAVEPKSNKTLFVPGGFLEHRRAQIRKVRANVASVGTRSAKRLLKRLSGREKAVTQQMVHIASKKLVGFAKAVGAKTIVMENLVGIQRSEKKFNKEQRARNHRWPYNICQTYIDYKAANNGIKIVYVPPANTSCTCVQCGHIEKINRSGLNFKCARCGYSNNADRVGAINIARKLLSQRQVIGKGAAINPLIVANSLTV